MPFCPMCRAEFIESAERCNDCGMDLIATISPEHRPEDFDPHLVNICVCYDAQTAQRIEHLLHDAQIETMVRDAESSAFPTFVGFTSRKFIAVPESWVPQARQLIAQAMEDAMLMPAEGQLLGVKIDQTTRS